MLYKDLKLKESPIAHDGEYTPSVSDKVAHQHHISKAVLIKLYKEIPLFRQIFISLLNDKELKLYQSNDKTVYYFGFFYNETTQKQGREFVSEQFKIIASLEVNFANEFIKYGYSNPIQVSTVNIGDSNLRGQGIGLVIYETVMSLGFQIISDYNQYDGARALYRKMSQRDHLRIDVIDEVEETVKQNHIITLTDFEKLDKEWSAFPDTTGDRYLFAVVML